MPDYTSITVAGTTSYQTHRVQWAYGGERTMKYKVGDKVRIVRRRTGNDWNPDGHMDKWLGRVMTIKEVQNVYANAHYVMEEDQNTEHRAYGWCWYEHMIEGYASETAAVNVDSDFYYGKVVCVDNKGNEKNYTVGKTYEIVEGQFVNDLGKIMPLFQLKSFAEFQEWTKSKFEEVVE